MGDFAHLTLPTVAYHQRNNSMSTNSVRMQWALKICMAQEYVAKKVNKAKLTYFAFLVKLLSFQISTC